MTLFDQDKVSLATQYLVDRDTKLAEIIEEVGPLQIEAKEDEFLTLCSTIINQQLSGKASATIFGRVNNLAQDYGGFNAEALSKIPIDKLKACGVSRTKSEFIIGIAELLHSNPTMLHDLKKLDDKIALQSLTQIRGVGMWTASIYLMSCQGCMNIFPLGDGTLQRAINIKYAVSAVDHPKKYLKVVEKWTPYKSLAASYLWAWIDAPKNN